MQPPVAPSGDSASHIVNYGNHQHLPGGGTTFAKRRHNVSNYISPLSFGKSFMKIRSAVPENGCLIVLVDGKKTKKQLQNIYTSASYRKAVALITLAIQFVSIKGSLI